MWATTNMDAGAFASAITRTRAVPVLNGRICDMERIIPVAERHGLAVIEDAAQALGATLGGRPAGSFGRAGCFSFYPFKLLGCFGDGGAVTTNDPVLARAVRLLRYNGEDRDTGEYHYHGYTAPLDNVQAAVPTVKLGHLREWIAHRQCVARWYRAGLEGVGDLRLPHFGDPRHGLLQKFTSRTSCRDALRDYLRNCGVETLVHWPKPVAARGLRLGEWHLPKTVAICGEALSLPISAETTADDVDYVVNATRRFFDRRRT